CRAARHDAGRVDRGPSPPRPHPREVAGSRRGGNPSTSPGSTIEAMTPSPSSRLTVDAPTGSDAAPHRRVPVPRWLLWTAVAVPLWGPPSATWRAVHGGAVVHGGPGPCGTPGLGSVLYMSSLSIVSVGLALLTLGLVRPWGEVFPRWIPGVGGR